MRPSAVVASTLAGTLAVLAALHVWWALSGAPAGATVPSRADGRPVFRPSRAATLAVAAGLGAAAALVLARAGLLGDALPAPVIRGATWVLAAALVLRVVGEFRYVGLFKRERGTGFARLDTRVYTPLCAALAAGVLYLALG